VPDDFDDFKRRLAASRDKNKKPPEQLADTPPSGNPEPVEPTQLAPSTWTVQKPRKRGQKLSTELVDNQKLPPHSVEAELGVISSIMADSQTGGRTTIAHVCSRINENYFYIPAHRTLFEMLVSLWRAGRPMDLIAFTEFLRTKSLLDSVGGATKVTDVHGYIDQVTRFVPTAAGVDYYVALMIEKFARREVIADATRLVRSAYGDTEDQFTPRVQRLSGRMAHIGSIVQSSNGRFPQLQDTAEFFETEDPPLPPLVIWHLLHQGSKMLLGGNSKGRKTWALLDLAISVATGADWWGFHCRKGPVCYINLEIQPQFFRMRCKKICETKNVQPEHGMFFHWPLRGHAKPMTELIKDILGFLQQHKLSLVIIDPIYKTLPPFSGSENDSAMITQLLNEVETITIDTGAAVLFCSHFSKGDQSEKVSMDRVSGSGAWSRDPDTLLTMTAHEENDCFTVDATLRNLAPMKPFVVQWDYPLFMRQDEMNPDRLKKRGPKGTPPEKLLDVLSEFTGQEPKDVIAQMKNQHDVTRATVYRLKVILNERGQFRADDEGLWYKVKPETDPKQEVQ
jgi:RecA-family ATPase